LVPADAVAGQSGVVFSVVRRGSRRSITLTQEELAFIKAISNLQLSPSVLKELRTTFFPKESQWCQQGAAAPRQREEPEPPNDHRDSSRASAKPTNWLPRATHPSPETGAQLLAKDPRLCPQVQRQSRENKLLRAAGNSVRRMVG
jgi:hypothetical protein